MKNALAASLLSAALAGLSLTVQADPLPHPGQAQNGCAVTPCTPQNVPIDDLQDRFTNAYLKAILDQVKSEVEKNKDKDKDKKKPASPPAPLAPSALPPQPAFPIAPPMPPMMPPAPPMPPAQSPVDIPGTGVINDGPPQDSNPPIPNLEVPPNRVPEPASLLLTAAALAGLAWTQKARARRLSKSVAR